MYVNFSYTLFAAKLCHTIILKFNNQFFLQHKKLPKDPNQVTETNFGDTSKLLGMLIYLVSTLGQFNILNFKST